jgi:phosphate transport system protein
VPTRPAFLRSLDELWNQLADLAQLDVVAMERASLAMLDANRQLAELVISEQSDIAALGETIEEHAAAMIAREAPVASDLRLVLGAIPISSSLSRMGALAAHVAETARLRAPGPTVAPELREVFTAMGEIAAVMAANLVLSFRERDVEAAAAVEAADDRMDELHRRLFTVVLAPAWTGGIEPAIDAALLGRYYERYADQAVGVAKRIHFIVTGEQLPTV